MSDLNTVLVVHLSGNTGKTTIARHLLAPRMDGAQLVSVETINADGEEEKVIKGKQFALLQQAILSGARVVADVGASNIESFLLQMRQYTESHEDFDLFVVPVVPSTKQMRDTVSTIEELAAIGVPPEKIRVVFNNAELDADLTEVFQPIFAYAKKGTFILNANAVVPQNELLSQLKGSDKSVADLATDPTDYRAMIRATDDPDEKVKYANALASVRLARGLLPKLDTAFAALTKGL